MEEGINLPDIIICPKCKHELTHQIATEIFSRKEDGEEMAEGAPTLLQLLGAFIADGAARGHQNCEPGRRGRLPPRRAEHATRQPA